MMNKPYAVIAWNEKGIYHAADVIAWYFSSYHAEKKAAELTVAGGNIVVRQTRFLR